MERLLGRRAHANSMAWGGRVSIPLSHAREWFLDQRRTPKQLLGVFWRKQLPLAPTFTTTAHAAQGQTVEAVIVALQLGRGVGIFARYTAFTRVRKREDLLIFRPFDRAPLQRGPPRGPHLIFRFRVEQ